MSLIHSIVNLSFKKGKRVYDPQQPPDYPAARQQELRQNRFAQAPRCVQIRESVMGNVPVEWLTKPQNPKDKTILYIHGGGFVVGSVKTRRSFTGYVVNKLHYNVLAAEYRLAPEHPFPAAPEGCFAVYRALLAQYAPQNIVIIGESAGGNLVLSVLLQIRQAGLPQPAAAICISPCVQFDTAFPSYSKNAASDNIVSNISDEIIASYLNSHDEQAVKNPMFAPYYGDFTGCAPIYLWASTSEVLLDDSVKLYKKLKKSHQPCNLYLRSGMMHTWVIIPYFSEATQDLKRMKHHLDDAFSGVFHAESNIVHLS